MVQQLLTTTTFRPQSSRQVFILCFTIILALACIVFALIFNPLILLFLVIFVPGIVFPIMYMRNGFISVTPEAIELSGFTGKITKRITYDTIYKVALVNELVVAATSGALGYAVVFLDKNGDQLFFVWSINYTKQDIAALFNLFAAEDKVIFNETLYLNELKQRIIKLASN